MGGLGESVARVLSENYPTLLKIIGTNDTFGESAKPDQLMEKYGLGVSNIIAAAKKAIERKLLVGSK